MKRLLSTTAALSMALAPLQPWPLLAQEVTLSLTDDGRIVDADGMLLCTPLIADRCNIEALLADLAAAEATGGADGRSALMTELNVEAQTAEAEAGAAAQGAADAAAQAEADAAAKAATDAAQAEADAAAKAAADAAQADADAAAKAASDAAQAEADAAAQADADAAAQAATDAAQADADAAAKAATDAAQADADAAAQAATDAAQADADAAAQAATDAAQADADAAAKAATDAAKADADAAAKAATDAAQADADAAAKAATDAAQTEADAAQAAADAAAKAATDAAQAEADAANAAEVQTDAPLTPDAPLTDAPLAGDAVAEQPEEPISAEAEAALAAAAAAEAEASAAATVTADAPAAAPVDAPVVSEEQVQVLSDLLASPDIAGAAGLGAAAALVGGAAGNAPAEAVPEGEGQSAPADVTVTTVTEADTRSSFEEFTAAPTAVEGGKRSGLSDLEKVGLVALGALVVGAALSGGREVVANTGDRVVVQNDQGEYQIYKDDDTLLRRPGSTVRTESYRDGSTRSIVLREDGTEVVTIRDASGRVLRRATYDQTGNEVILIDDMAPEEVIDVTTLPRPREDRVTISTRDGNAALKAALARSEAEQIGRSFSLRQIREIKEVRRLAATIDVENITFETNSAVIRTTEARKLADLGRVIREVLAVSPDEVFLIEGHTDAVGGSVPNLTLSDRRAESVALALTEYFGIPPENLVVQGYGESDLRVQTLTDEQLNRRVAVRVVSPLLRTASN